MSLAAEALALITPQEGDTVRLMEEVYGGLGYETTGMVVGKIFNYYEIILWNTTRTINACVSAPLSQITIIKKGNL